MICREDVAAIQAVVSTDEDPFRSACRVIGAMAAVIELHKGPDATARIFEGIAKAVREAPLAVAPGPAH